MSELEGWALDASTFINFAAIARFSVLVRCRRGLRFPEYVFTFELTGPKAKEPTRVAAEQAVQRGDVTLTQLTLTDLGRIAALGAPRRIGLGEIACAIIAERDGAGVLCDDHKAILWLKQSVQPLAWESTEDVLLDAANQLLLSEFDLADAQETLRENRYECRVDLRSEYLQRRLIRQQ